MVLHLDFAVVAAAVLARAAVDVVVVIVYAANIAVALLVLAAVRGVHLLCFIHGGRRRWRRPRRGRRKSTQFLARLDRDDCCRHSIHW